MGDPLDNNQCGQMAAIDQFRFQKECFFSYLSIFQISLLGPHVHALDRDGAAFCWCKRHLSSGCVLPFTQRLWLIWLDDVGCKWCGKEATADGPFLLHSSCRT